MAVRLPDDATDRQPRLDDLVPRLLDAIGGRLIVSALRHQQPGQTQLHVRRERIGRLRTAQLLEPLLVATDDTFRNHMPKSVNVRER